MPDLSPETQPPAEPAPQTEPPKPKRKRQTGPSFLQESELDRLFKAIDSVRDRAIFRLAYHAGLRASEVGMLELRDYDPNTERIEVHRLKGSHGGWHHMTREEARAFRAWLKVRGSFPGPIFLSKKRSPISRERLDKLMKQYGAKAGIPVKLRHFHVLKHCCATHLLSRGFGVERVQDWIGHANIQSTLKYAKVTNARRTDMGSMLKEWK